ncbi:MAG TPA: hypothetical protein VN843_02935 [Anaerolineales bacterium]|nr:hypothetical protein [Anaerolineales bacterium]
MQLMLHLKPNTARIIRWQLPASAGSSDLLNKARELGIKLRPLRTTSEDSDLASGFTVEVSNQDMAERVARELRECDAVESAYFVPSDELP